MVRMSQDSSERRKRKSEERGISTGHLRKEPLTLPHDYGTKGLKGSFRAKVEPHRLMRYKLQAEAPGAT